MKTIKAKTTSTAKKSPVAAKTAKSKKSVGIKAEPTEDAIRMKAQEIYSQRISSGEYGSAAEDWHRAEKILRGF